MRAIGVALAALAPGVVKRPRNLECFLRLLVIRLEFIEADRPIAPIAECRAALEPLGSPAERDHRVVDRASTDTATAVVGAEFDWIGAARDPVIRPVKPALPI